MKCILIEHEGFKPAMLGAMLSYGKASFGDLCFYSERKLVRLSVQERFGDLSKTLVKSGAGHDKFLEQI